MKKVISVFLVIVIALTLSVNAFAATVSRPVANATRDSVKAKFDASVNRFDVNGSAQIDAEDARQTLRYSAGIAEGNLDTAKMDVDGDGMVTAIDARSILRLSAGLEKIDSYLTNAEKLEYFNAILNTAIPNSYKLYKNGIEHTRKISYTDPKGVVKSLDEAFKKVDSTMSFAEELKKDEGEEKYYQSTVLGYQPGNAASRMMEIHNAAGVDENQSSYLTLDDISSIEYLQNQTYTFTRYKTDDNQITSQVLYSSQPVTGLDCIKVKIKEDNNVKGAHASKAFIVYDEKEIEEEVKVVAEEFNKMSMDLSIFGNMYFDVKPSVGGVKYYNTEITIYYHPENGQIVAAYYSMYTDYTMVLNMDVDITIPLYIIYIDVTGPVSITNTTQSIKEYYFIENNPNHIPW